MGDGRGFEIDGELAALFGFKPHPGYIGVFTRAEAEGAWHNGTVVIKTACDPSGDLTPLGTIGTVRGSIRHPNRPDYGVMYFIEWNDKPRMVIGCLDKKLMVKP